MYYNATNCQQAALQSTEHNPALRPIDISAAEISVSSVRPTAIYHHIARHLAMLHRHLETVPAQEGLHHNRSAVHISHL